jgi:hypothetical protein
MKENKNNKTWKEVDGEFYLLVYNQEYIGRIIQDYFKTKNLEFDWDFEEINIADPDSYYIIIVGEEKSTQTNIREEVDADWDIDANKNSDLFYESIVTSINVKTKDEGLIKHLKSLTKEELMAKNFCNGNIKKWETNNETFCLLVYNYENIGDMIKQYFMRKNLNFKWEYKQYAIFTYDDEYDFVAGEEKSTKTKVWEEPYDINDNYEIGKDGGVNFIAQEFKRMLVVETEDAKLIEYLKNIKIEELVGKPPFFKNIDTYDAKTIGKIIEEYFSKKNLKFEWKIQEEMEDFSFDEKKEKRSDYLKILLSGFEINTKTKVKEFGEPHPS